MDNPSITVRRHWVERRHWIQLGIVAVIVFLLVPHLVGVDRVLAALRHANPGFIALAIGAEVLRYVASANSTRALARMFERHVPLSPLVQAFFAGAAANRMVSTGGAPGMLVRLLCLRRHGVTTGSVAAIFLIENINGLIVGVPTLLVGIALFASTRAALPLERYIGALPIGGILLVVVLLYLYTRRTWVERVALWCARGLDHLARRVLHRAVFHPERVLKWIGDFYDGMTLAVRYPLPATISLAMNVVRNFAGLLALYSAFRAVDATIGWDVLILVYTSASFLTTLSAAPGEVAIMGSGIVLLAATAGMPQAIAMTALLISRALAFWLPLPIGYAALWNLIRQGHI
ncbi:MAG: flippase-like domain-containing protein [Chloroflexi bacterium]|nr:flippase-like domain-containing protein [Chloroflexota bacterium]